MQQNDIDNKLKAELRNARERRNMTQADVAEKIFVVPDTVQKWEKNGKIPPVRYQELCQAIGDDFFTGVINDITDSSIRGAKIEDDVSIAGNIDGLVKNYAAKFPDILIRSLIVKTDILRGMLLDARTKTDFIQLALDIAEHQDFNVHASLFYDLLHDEKYTFTDAAYQRVIRMVMLDNKTISVEFFQKNVWDYALKTQDLEMIRGLKQRNIPAEIFSGANNAPSVYTENGNRDSLLSIMKKISKDVKEGAIMKEFGKEMEGAARKLLGLPAAKKKCYVDEDVEKFLKKRAKAAMPKITITENNIADMTICSQSIGLPVDGMNVTFPLVTYRDSDGLITGNTNMLIVGGDDMTSKYVQPNILQQNCSQVIFDKYGESYKNFAPYLREKGYNVYVLNLWDKSKSDYYNPLLNLYDTNGNISEIKVDALVDLFMKYAKNGRDLCNGDPFWNRAEIAFLTGLIYYVLENDDISIMDKNLSTIERKISNIIGDTNRDKTLEDCRLSQEISILKERLGRDCKAAIYYETFLVAPDKTRTRIVETTLADLNTILSDSKTSMKDACRITSYDESHPFANIRFDDLAETQTYIFVIPGTNDKLGFLLSAFYSQMYARLYELGEKGLREKYVLEKTSGISECRPFDSEQEIEEFYAACKYGNVSPIEVPHRDGTSIYGIFWRDKVIKKSCKKDALDKFIEDVSKERYAVKTHVYPQLPMHVNFVYDEFGYAAGEIPYFLTILSTCCKYRIGNHVLTDSIKEVIDSYEDRLEYETFLVVTGNIVYMGSIKQEDREEMSKIAPLSKEQLEQLDRDNNDMCIVKIHDMPIIVDRKAYPTEHPDYENYESFMNSRKEEE